MNSASSPAVALVQGGLAGPFALSAPAQALLQPLLREASVAEAKRNLHAHSPTALGVVADRAVRECVEQLCGTGYRLWRTNFFQRELGEPHPGVPWHHDKHFQDGDAPVDFQEVGDHLSIVIGLDQIDHRNGPFRYIPGSFHGELPGLVRDIRPYTQRPYDDHCLQLPPLLEAQAVQLNIPAGHFCLFHSALLHGSAPSAGLAARTSMVGRLVRQHCRIPQDCARPDEVIPFC